MEVQVTLSVRGMSHRVWILFTTVAAYLGVAIRAIPLPGTYTQRPSGPQARPPPSPDLVPPLGCIETTLRHMILTTKDWRDCTDAILALHEDVAGAQLIRLRSAAWPCTTRRCPLIRTFDEAYELLQQVSISRAHRERAARAVELLEEHVNNGGRDSTSPHRPCREGHTSTAILTPLVYAEPIPTPYYQQPY